MLGIINARLETVSNGLIEEGQILIADGKILDVGKKVDLSGCSKIIDAKGRIVTPGIIDAHTHVSGLLLVLPEKVYPFVLQLITL